MIHIDKDHPAYRLAVERMKVQASAKRVMEDLKAQHQAEFEARAKTFKQETDELEKEINALLPEGTKVCCGKFDLFESTGLVVFEPEGHHGGDLGGFLGKLLGGGLMG